MVIRVLGLTAILAGLISLSLPITVSHAFDKTTAVNRTVKIYRDNLLSEDTFLGSGVYADNGIILSAGHVCAVGIGGMHFAFDKRYYSGPFRVLFSRTDPDLCLIVTEMRPKKKLPPLKLGKSLGLNNRGPIYILGYPADRFTIERGFVIAERRYSDTDTFFMLDRAAMPGISGGPAFYKDGTLAGIVVAMSIVKNGREHGAALLEGVQTLKRWLKKEGVEYVE